MSFHNNKEMTFVKKTTRRNDDNIRTHSQESTLDANMIKILLCLIFSKAFRLPRQGHVAVLGGGVGVASMRAITEQAASLSQPLPHHNKDSPVHHERQYTEVIHPDCLTQQLANPTSRTKEATNDYHQVEQERIEVNLSPKRPQLSPQHQCNHLPGKRVLCQEKAKV